jgi:hypothetical protein
MLKFVTINSGAAISAEIDLKQFRLAAIFVPTVTSGFLGLQGNFDSTSGSFYRLLDTRGQQGSGDLRFPIGAGSLSIPWPSILPTPALAKLEIINAGSLQTDTRTLVLSLLPR